MKLTKRMLSGFLALVMVLSLCPVITFAEDTTETPREAVQVPLLGTNAPAGKDPSGSNVIYLSDLYSGSRMVGSLAALDKNGNVTIKKDVNADSFLCINTSTKAGAKSVSNTNNTTAIYNAHNRYFTKTDIALGIRAVKYTKGLSMLPNAIGGEDSYVIYNVQGLNRDRFYAVVGGTSSTLANINKDVMATFEVWGSKSSTDDFDAGNAVFEKLAWAEGIMHYQAAEFDVDIAGYKYIKLVVRLVDGPLDTNNITTNGGCAVAWGDACFYNSGVVTAKKLSTIGSKGTIKGMPADAGNIHYLSSLHTADDALATNDYVVDQVNSKIMLNQNYNGDLFIYNGTSQRTQVTQKLIVDENGDPVLTEDGKKQFETVTEQTITMADGSQVTYYPAEIALGYKGTKFAYGLGVHPDATGTDDRYITYDVSGLGVSHFYAVVGGTGSSVTNLSLEDPYVTFELWGSKTNGTSHAAFEKLASVDNIRAFLTAEFDVDITGYKYIRLVTKMTKGSNSSCAVAWGNACVYGEAPVVQQLTPAGSAAQINGTAVQGLPEGITSQHYLSDLGLFYSPALVAQNNNKVTLDTNYSDNLIIWNGGGTTNANRYVISKVRAKDANGADILDNGNPTYVDGETVTEQTIPMVDAAGNAYEATYNVSEIALGYLGTKYAKGLGVHPDNVGNADRFLVFDVRGMNADYFYAVVGGTGPASTSLSTDRKAVVELWASKGTTYDEKGFVKLASADGIRAYLVSEFNVNIEGYNFIKLVYKMTDTSVDNSSFPLAFGNACVYSTEEPIPSFTTNGTYHTELDAGSTYTQRTWTGVTKAEVTAYEQKLIAAGWTEYDFSDVKDNRFATYVDGKGKMIHLNYFPAQDSGRFHLIYGPDSMLIPNTQIGSDGNVTPSVSIIKRYIGTLCMVVQLSDGSFVVIDGGYGSNGEANENGEYIWEQDPKYAKDKNNLGSSVRDYQDEINILLSFMEENKPAEHEKPQVYWLATHAHSDHVQQAYIIFWSKAGDGGNHKERIDLKGLIYNFPNYENIGLNQELEDPDYPAEMNKLAYERFIAKARESYPEVKLYVYHTGQTMKLPGVEIEFLFTAEDNRPYDMPTGNNTSGVMRFTFDGGKTLMVTGDAQQIHQLHSGMGEYQNNDHLFKVYGNYLKSDMLQVIHHGTNGGSEAFYNAVDPDICFYGQLSVNLDNDLRQTGEWTGYEFNKILRDGERVIYTCSQTNTVYIPTMTYNDQGVTKTEAVLYSNATAYQGTNPDGSYTYSAQLSTGKEGYTFYGWAVGNDSFVSYKAGQTRNVTESANLTAIYAKNAANVTVGDDSAWNGKIGDIVGNVDYLSDREGGYDAITGSDTKVFYNTPYNAPSAENYFYSAPGSRWKVNGKALYNKLNADGTTAKDEQGNVIQQTGIRDYEINGAVVSVHVDKLYLGGYATLFEKGLGVHPSALGAADRSVVYATNGADYFYAVAGVNGSNSSDPKNGSLEAYLDFEVWGSTSDDPARNNAYVLLAKAEKVSDWYTAEFNVDVSGYNYVKLVVKMNEDTKVIKSGTGTNSGCAAAWGDACVYSITAPVQDKEVSFAGKAENATNIQWLSDLFGTANKVADLNNSVMLDQNYNGDLFAFDGAGGRKQIKLSLDENGERELANGIKYKPTDIALGWNGTKFNKGLGVHPAGVGDPDHYIIYNVSNLNVDRFYAVVGATGSNITDPKQTGRDVIFEVWGSTASEYAENIEFVKLAQSDLIREHYISELDVDITGYNFIKLVVKMDSDSVNNYACAVAWGDACVYSTVPAHEHTPGTPVEENRTEATCTTPGSYDKVTYCASCGEKLSTEHVVIPTTNHSYGDWVVTKDATCTETGSKEQTCSACGDVKTEVIPTVAHTPGK
ncbi:MAG: NPCBM/NEW2 domain-containing protein, partial [Oscillospiraceae bacterium]|nr:NPCBM/NEW2 domain-containing protein [Oscillospiraceae bacterium]